jgi:hypothetical protein
MRPIKRNTCDDAVSALEAALRIIEKKSLQKAEAGATLWVKPDGSNICVRMTPEDAARIRGALFIGGPCRDVEKAIR